VLSWYTLLGWYDMMILWYDGTIRYLDGMVVLYLDGQGYYTWMDRYDTLDLLVKDSTQGYRMVGHDTQGGSIPRYYTHGCMYMDGTQV
jgi:hypothetical protein